MFATINDVRLFYDVLNPKLEIVGAKLKDKPTVVCLPGGPGGDHQTLRPFFDRFASVVQVVYLDPRGGGRSDHGDASQWTLEQWGDDIAAFCDAIGLEKPIVLGSSGGTLMVQSYLARHPSHPGGAILINACSRMTQDGLIAGYEKLGGPEAGRAARAMYGQPTPEDYTAFFKHCLPLYSAKRDLTSLSEGRERVVMNRAASEHFFAPRTGEAWRFDHRAAPGAGLGAVRSPVLLLVGELDPVTPAVWGREVANSLPTALSRLVILDQSSHLIVADEPARLQAEIEAFIAGL
jgi:proline iminopeptidase